MPIAKHITGALLLGSFFLAAQAQAALPTLKTQVFSLSFAQLYTEGNYGEETDSQMQASVIRAAFRNPHWGISLSLPRLSIEGTATVLFEDIDTGELFFDEIDDEKRSGLGDMVISGDVKLWQSARKHQKLSGGSAIKFPTGDEDKQLSSGETDISFFIKGRNRWKKNIFNAQLGIQIMGEPEFTEYNDRFFASLSALHLVNRNLGLGTSLRYKDAAIDGRDAQKAISGFLTWKPASEWIVTLRATSGLSDAVADFGAGLQLTRQWRF